MRAVIFCGGVIEDYSYLENKNFDDCLIICADSGYRHAIRLGIEPDVIIGDNDSWKKEYPKEIKIIECPAEKDYTDTNRCIDYAIEKGCSDIDIYGGLGGRLDHEFSNYCLLAYGLQRGTKIRLIDKYNEVRMEDKPFCLTRGDKKYVSFFPYGGAVEGFSVRGLKYEAENMRLTCSEAKASSNEFADGDFAEIDIKSGMLIVMLCDDVD